MVTNHLWQGQAPEDGKWTRTRVLCAPAPPPMADCGRRQVDTDTRTEMHYARRRRRAHTTRHEQVDAEVKTAQESRPSETSSWTGEASGPAEALASCLTCPDSISEMKRFWLRMSSHIFASQCARPEEPVIKKQRVITKPRDKNDARACHAQALVL